MDRRMFMKDVTGALASFHLGRSTVQAESKERRPNVVFILPDQWRGQALGCTGNPDVRTPHLDRLASEGVLFEKTFANTPVCCPARADILTGTYANRNGMVANDLRLKETIVTLADLYSRAGYRTGYVGKWHLDGGPRLPGFVPPGARRHGFQYWAANECNHNYFYGWYFRDENVPIVTEKYEPEYWTDLAIEFLYESQDQPFFLMLALGTPHDPYLAPQKYMDLYDPKKLTMQPNWVEGTRGDEGASREDIAAYYASMTAIDDQIGKILTTLRGLNLEENTIVFFSSDHGNMLGSLGKTGKRKPWEESIRVPGILRHTGTIPSGRRTQALFSHVDFAPTLLSLCRLPAPEEMQGADLSRVALGATEQGPNSVYFQIFGPYRGDRVEKGWRGIRTERFMYARSKSGPWILYDIDKDPYEMRNLVEESSAGSLLQHLDRMLLDKMKQARDSWNLNWTDPVEDDGRLYTYRTFYTVQEYLAWAREHPYLVRAN